LNNTDNCFHLDYSVPEAIEESNECQVITKIFKNKCNKHSDVYTFHDILVRTVCHIQIQPSNKEYFEPKGSLCKEMKTMTK
jgi:uncharacterized protein involved in tolerance to divalent cations